MFISTVRKSFRKLFPISKINESLSALLNNFNILNTPWTFIFIEFTSRVNEWEPFDAFNIEKKNRFAWRWVNYFTDKNVFTAEISFEN